LKIIITVQLGNNNYMIMATMYLC